MSKQTTQANSSATATKTQQKPAPAPTQELMAAPAATSLLEVAGTASFQNSAQRLGNPQLPRIQRQMMAGRIGQQQGNGHLGQVVTHTKQRPHNAFVHFKNVQTKGFASANIVKTKPKPSSFAQNQSQTDEANPTEEQRAGEESVSLIPVAGGAAGNSGTPNLAHTVENRPAQNESIPLAAATAPMAAKQATVQRWGLSDLVPDSVKKIGRGIAKAATDTWDKVANVAQIALDYVAKKAGSIPGYTLLTFVLGKDPIADQEVPRTPMNLVQGVVSLIPGGEQLFKNLQESNVLQQVFDWLDEQLTKLNLTWTYVQGLFSKAWKALSIGDFVPPSKAFNKVKQIFSPLIAKIKNFAVAAGNKIWEMALEGALKLVGPGGGKVLGIIKKAGAAFGKIIKDPIGFLGNLISGVGQGIEKFGGRILDHLKNGFVAWLTGAAPGLRIQIPEDIFSLSGIFTLVTQVLGLTWDYVRQKAVKVVGERVVSAAEKAFEPFQILITQGPGGLWEYLKGQLSNMAEMVVGQIKDLMITQAIEAGIKWVMKLLSPASALLGAAKAIYDIVMFVVDKAGQIGDFVGAVMNSIAAIANGAVGSAASLIERALAKALPLVIGLMANLAGLGDIAKKVMGVIHKVKAKIDGVIEKLIGKVKGLFGRGKGEKKDKHSEKDRRVGLAAFEKEQKTYIKDGVITRENAAKVATAVKSKHPIFKSVIVVDGETTWNYSYIFRSVKGGARKASISFDAWDPIVEDVANDKAAQKEEKFVQTRLASNDVSLNRKILKQAIDNYGSPHIRKKLVRLQRRAARQEAFKFFDLAVSASDAHTIYANMQKAQRAVNDLLGSGTLDLQSHHIDQVAQNPRTFKKDRKNRIRARLVRLAKKFPEKEQKKIVNVSDTHRKKIMREWVEQTYEQDIESKRDLPLDEISIIFVPKRIHFGVIHKAEREEAREKRKKEKEYYEPRHSYDDWTSGRW